MLKSALEESPLFQTVEALLAVVDQAEADVVERVLVALVDARVAAGVQLEEEALEARRRIPTSG